MLTITELGREFYDLKAEKDQLEDRLKLINARLDELGKNIIPSYMEQHEQEKVALKDIGTIYLQADSYVSIPSGDATVIPWMKKHGHGDIVKETIHPATLKSWANEQLEHGGKLPPALKIHQFMKAILRRK